MKKIFFAYIFMLISFDFNIDIYTIGVFPDFVGSILLLLGLREMATESKNFKKIKPVALSMAIYSTILYALDLAGVFSSFILIPYFLGVVYTGINVYMMFCVIKGIEDIENKNPRKVIELGSDKLMFTWRIVAFIETFYALSIVSTEAYMVMAIMSIGMSVVFIAYLNSTRDLFEKTFKK